MYAAAAAVFVAVAEVVYNMATNDQQETEQ
jgi:hypothetical protein